MRKFTLLATLACALLGTPAFAQQYNADTEKVYDYSSFNDGKVLELFAKALDKGRAFPTEEEFKAEGISAAELAFMRSHVRPRNILGQGDRLVQSTQEGRNLWMNIPSGDGKLFESGYPSGQFGSDVYSMWNYTKLFGSWNHGLFSAPGAWLDAAHKHGTDMFSGIKFFDTTGNAGGVDASGWKGVILKKNANGTFRYAEPLINVLMYFGSDGINYNWEANSYDEPEVIQFHQELYRLAKQKNFINYHSGIYTSNSILNTGNVDALFGDQSKGGKTHDLMLNYMSGNFTADYAMKTSIQTAKSAMGTTDGLYTGVWIVTMNRSWSNLNKNKEIGVCLWGEHASSRFWSYNKGEDAYDVQRNYQRLLERGFSGGHRNPMQRPVLSDEGNNWEKDGDKLPLSTFAGLAEFIPERSTIQGKLPFATNFNLGNGDRFNFKGIKTAPAYYNMASQDMVPTYRWLVTDAGTTTYSKAIQPEFSHDDAYIGGSCLELTGDASKATDIILYKTDLEVSAANPKVVLAVKRPAGEGASALAVIVKVDGNWIEVPYGNVAGKTWEEKELAIAGLSQGQKITAIGLRVKEGEANYKMNVGRLMISDDRHEMPANIKQLTVELRKEYKKRLTAKLFWTVDKEAVDRKDNGLLYNDEANIDHFEVVYKNKENGQVRLIGNTSQWAYLLSDFEVAEDETPYIGVRAVSTDLKCYSPVQWVAVTRRPASELTDGEVDPYGVSQLDPASEGAAVARVQRYVTEFTTTGATQNLNYTSNEPVADGTNYKNARDHKLIVAQGQKVTLKLLCANFGDGLKWCVGRGWIDLDGSNSFDPETIQEKPESGERIFEVGEIRKGTEALQVGGVTAEFTVPNDARPGQSRLRIVFADAWKASTCTPTGLTDKGFTIDFDVEITGNPEGARGAADLHDQGMAQEPERIHDANPNVPSAIETIKGGLSRATVDGKVLRLEEVDEAWIYAADGKFLQYVQGQNAVDVQHFAPGAYLVKMQRNNVIRTDKVLVP